MQAYRIIRYDDDPHPEWTGSLGEAHQTAKQLGDFNGNLRIELFDVPIDKAGVLALLRGLDLTAIGVERTWMITPRGGLKEVPNGE